MPRTARASVGGLCYHVFNRGNGRATVFHDNREYTDFVALMVRATDRVPMRVLAYCLMPNHFHLVLWPRKDGELSGWMHYLMTCHVRRFHCRHRTDGRIWQGRFKAFPIQRDDHLVTVLRYVERNPLRGGLVSDPGDWRWSSFRQRVGSGDGRWIAASPVEISRDWGAFVREAQTVSELKAIRDCARRGRPFGDLAWSRGTAGRLGLEFSLNPPGRPRSPIVTGSPVARE
jgi:putative transposase